MLYRRPVAVSACHAWLGREREDPTYDLQVFKVGGNVAIALELGYRFRPRSRVWISSGDVRGCRASREKPDIDIRARPLGGDDATTNAVEVCTVGLGVLILDIAAGVGALVCGIDIAVGGAEGASESTVVGNGTIVRGM